MMLYPCKRRKPLLLSNLFGESRDLTVKKTADDNRVMNSVSE